MANPYYQGAFQFDIVSEIVGFHYPEIYPFDPSEFSEYIHTMTHQEESALDGSDKLITLLFELK